jgi:hypothetical protein
LKVGANQPDSNIEHLLVISRYVRPPSLMRNCASCHGFEATRQPQTIDGLRPSVQTMLKASNRTDFGADLLLSLSLTFDSAITSSLSLSLSPRHHLEREYDSHSKSVSSTHALSLSLSLSFAYRIMAKESNCLGNSFTCSSLI